LSRSENVAVGGKHMEALWKIAAPASVVLTLATWLLFKYARATSPDPLGPADLTVVFAFWFCVTLVARWIWRHFLKKSPQSSSPEAPKP
jgi:hypothetical protein